MTILILSSGKTLVSALSFYCEFRCILLIKIIDKLFSLIEIAFCNIPCQLHIFSIFLRFEDFLYGIYERNSIIVFDAFCNEYLSQTEISRTMTFCNHV